MKALFVKLPLGITRDKLVVLMVVFPATVNVPRTLVFPDVSTLNFVFPLTACVRLPVRVVFPVTVSEPDESVTFPLFAVPTVPPKQENVASTVNAVGIPFFEFADIIHICADEFVAGSRNKQVHSTVPSL